MGIYLKQAVRVNSALCVRLYQFVLETGLGMSYIEAGFILFWKTFF